MKKEVPWITIPLNEFADFLRAISLCQLGLACQKAQVLLSYDVKVQPVLTLLEKYMLAIKQQQKLSALLYSFRSQQEMLRDEMQNLKIQKTPMLDKKEQEVASLIQAVELVSKDKYEKAYNKKNTRQVDSIIKNMWEYHCLKRLSDKYRGPVKQKIVQPLRKSEQYLHIKELLTIQSQDINKIHQEYEVALRRMSNLVDEKKDLTMIPRRNKSLIESIQKRNYEDIVRANTFYQYQRSVNCYQLKYSNTQRETETVSSELQSYRPTITLNPFDLLSRKQSCQQQKEVKLQDEQKTNVKKSMYLLDTQDYIVRVQLLEYLNDSLMADNQFLRIKVGQLEQELSQKEIKRVANSFIQSKKDNNSISSISFAQSHQSFSLEQKQSTKQQTPQQMNQDQLWIQEERYHLRYINQQLEFENEKLKKINQDQNHRQSQKVEKITSHSDLKGCLDEF